MAIIKKESGGSVMRFASTASANFESGAELQFRDDATAQNSAYEMFKMGSNSFWYCPGSAGSPIISASPGDMLLLANSASTGLWLNVSDGTAGSKWYNVSVVSGSNPAAGP